MKILVCISNVPDTTTKIRFTDENKKLDVAGIQWIINPWDELALTRVVELKEDPAVPIDSVTLINVGTATTEPTLRKGLAIGADDAIRIDAEPKDAFFVAAQIAEVIKKKPFDIVICGIESSDYNGSAVGGMLSEFLDLPSVSAISAIQFENNELSITREIDGGKEVLSVPVPFIGIVQKGIAKEPRIPAMRGIMMARQKPLEVVPPADITPLTSTVQFELPSSKEPCKMVDQDNVKRLVELLQNEAKVL